MRKIADRCFQLDHSKGANGYVVVGDGHAAVIDPGLAGGARAVALELHGGETMTGPVTDIVLTHYDPDHAGAAAVLARELGVPVWVSAADARILRGDDAPPTGLRRLMGALMKPKVPGELREIEGAAEIFPGLAVVPAPGHTPGHLAFQWGPVLFVGDAVRVSDDGTLREFFGPLISDKAVAASTQVALNERISDEDIEWICAGHDAPVRVTRAAVA